MSLHNSSEFFFALIKQIPSPVFLVNSDAKFISATDKGARLSGYLNADEMLGTSVLDLRSPARRCAKHYVSQNNYVLKTKKKLDVLDIYNDISGSRRIFLTHKRPFYFKKEFCGVLVLLTEVYSNVFQKVLSFLSQSEEHFVGPGKEARSYTINKSFLAKDLSRREMDCLFYLVRGHTVKESAKALGLSYRTVESYLDNIKLKLACNTKKEILEYAVASGLLNYIPKSLIPEKASCILPCRVFLERPLVR